MYNGNQKYLEMTDTRSDKTFISSIKIKGLHFLPPVITTKRRIVLQKYKQQALKLEKRLQTCRNLRRNLQELLILKPYSDYFQSSESDSVTETESFSKRKLKTGHPQARYLRQTLSKEIVDIAEYGKDGINIICNKFSQNSKTIDTGVHNESRSGCNYQMESKTKATCNERDESVLKSIEKNSETLHDIVSPSSNLSTLASFSCGEQIISSPPRLIRSNSYILENPSPILLSYLEKLHHNDENFSKNSLEQKNSVTFKSEYGTSEYNTQNDLTKKKYITLEYDEVDMQEKMLHVVDPNCQLMGLNLSNHQYSNDIFNFTQEQVVSKKVDENCSINCSMLGFVENNLDCNLKLFKNINKIHNINEESKIVNELTISPSQSIDMNVENLETFFWKNCKYQPEMEICRRLSFKKESYRQLDDDLITIKQAWAASVIVAHVKGYLTRRLLKTERVQSLINTVKDALICALQLHTADTIEESDVELHRRLINQVTAACYTFHDIFFSTSISEKMRIISTDRQKKRDKAKRPTSAPESHQDRSASKLKLETTFSQSLTNI